MTGTLGAAGERPASTARPGSSAAPTGANPPAIAFRRAADSAAQPRRIARPADIGPEHVPGPGLVPEEIRFVAEDDVPPDAIVAQRRAIGTPKRNHAATGNGLAAGHVVADEVADDRRAGRAEQSDADARQRVEVVVCRTRPRVVTDDIARYPKLARRTVRGREHD